MNFLVDSPLSHRIVLDLLQAGHDATHVRDYGLQSASDIEILDLAEREGRIVVSADTDFGTLLAVRQSEKPSFILFRGSSYRSPKGQAKRLLANLSMVEEDLLQGSVVVIEDWRIRVRRLPIGGM